MFTLLTVGEKSHEQVFQPSGGWGNQRLILTWAMRAANAMERTLIVPMIGPHSMMWYGYDRLNASQMARADKVLDLDALNYGLVKGLRIHDGHLSKLRKFLPGRWKTYIKPKGTYWLTENSIRFGWRKRPERVVYWAKSSMWMVGFSPLSPPFSFALSHFVCREISLSRKKHVQNRKRKRTTALTRFFAPPSSQ